MAEYPNGNASREIPRFVALWGETFTSEEHGDVTLLYALDAEGNTFTAEPNSFLTPQWKLCIKPPAVTSEGSGNA